MSKTDTIIFVLYSVTAILLGGVFGGTLVLSLEKTEPTVLTYKAEQKIRVYNSMGQHLFTGTYVSESQTTLTLNKLESIRLAGAFKPGQDVTLYKNGVYLLIAANQPDLKWATK